MPKLRRPSQADLNQMSQAEMAALIVQLFDMLEQHLCEHRLRNFLKKLLKVFIQAKQSASYKYPLLTQKHEISTHAPRKSTSTPPSLDEYTLISIHGLSKRHAVEGFAPANDLSYDVLSDAEWFWYGPKNLADEKEPPRQVEASSLNPDMCWLRMDFEKPSGAMSLIPEKITYYLDLQDFVAALKSNRISIQSHSHGEFLLGTAKLTESGYVRR